MSNNTQSPSQPAEQALQLAFATQDWPKLTKECRKLLRKSANHQWAHRYLGFALHKQRLDEEALAAFDKALTFWPHDVDIRLNHAQTLIEMGQEWRAVPLLEYLVSVKPNAYVIWLKLSQALYRVQAHARGWECAQQCERLASNDEEKASAFIQKAIHRRELGEIRLAIADCTSALALNRLDITAHTNRLLFMLADPDLTAIDIRHAAEEFAAITEGHLKAQWPEHPYKERTGWDRLRVGFLSPDFRNHSVMYFTEGLLAQLDRRQFHVTAFHLHPGGDNITARVRRHVDAFVELGNRSYPEMRQLITDAKIDILIDLAGHTGNNGLLLMAGKHAPVQVSWLGYPATTGLQSIDFKITDEITDPDDADDQYSERLFRLNTLFCCYRPHIRNPLWRYQPAFEVQPTPALANGYVTFGSCNNLGKLTDNVLTLWGTLLKAVPTAHLLIEGKNLDNPEFRAGYQERCKRLGIDITRLELIPVDMSHQYLTYHRIDIALDPFPLTGGTTTFDLLWMGLPLVSMVGDTFKSRLSTGILSYLNKFEWLAITPDDYLNIAINMTNDLQALNEQRLAQRKVVERSLLMTEEVFNREFGNGLRAMWIEWMAKQQHPNQPALQAAWMDKALQEMPPEWFGPAPLGVGLNTGQRVSQAEAHTLLNGALEKAKKIVPDQEILTEEKWREVTELAETVLSAIPHDPVALACLAEIEHIHGHTNFALTYLKAAAEEITKS